VVGELQRARPGLRPVLYPSPYEAAAWAIVSARIRGPQAVAVRRRLATEHGEPVEVDGEALATFPAPERLLALQQDADRVSVDSRIRQYAVYLVTATRQPELFELPHLKRYIGFGASPRASINLILGARALALLRGRTHVLPQDVWTLAPDVLRHRIVLSYEALAENISAEDVVDQVIRKIPMPHIGLPGETESPYQAEQILKANTLESEVKKRRGWRLLRGKKDAAK